MLPAQLTRYQPGAIHSLDAQSDFTLFVLDYFFIATPAVARTFAALASSEPLWWRETPAQWPPQGLADLSRRIRRRFRGRSFPQWAHLYWAEHTVNTLASSGVQLRFLLVHEVDFSLARFWRFGRDCVTPVRRRGGGGGGSVGDSGGADRDGMEGDELGRPFKM